MEDSIFSEIIGYILFQTTFILLTTILYQAYFRKKISSTSQQRQVLGLFNGLSIIVCMTFPLEIDPGFIIDFRYIPLLIGYIYGSFKTGMILTSLLLAYRFMLGGIGFYVTLVTVSLLVIILFVTRKKTGVHLDLKHKAKYGVTLLLLINLSTIIGNEVLENFSFTQQEFVLWNSYLFFNLITMIAVLHLMESLREMDAIHYELVHVENMHTVSQMAASIAHEVRNPMTTAQGFLQLLTHTERITKKEQHFIRISIEELTRANQIINDYLSLAKKPNYERVPIDVKEEVHYAKSLVQSIAITKSIDITYQDLTKKPYQTFGNRNEFRQVLTNIIKNAVEAIEDPYGKITIKTYSRTDSFVIEVEDTGKGMSKEQIKSIGKAFFTTKETGTGLGILVCKKIIHSMNGKMEVVSKEGQGTKISIFVPIYP